jgi:hypothetical protein
VPKTVEIRPLARDDDRSGFRCGQADLDRFFEHYAGQNQFKLHLAVTYVAVAETRIVGFALCAPGALRRLRALPSPGIAATGRTRARRARTRHSGVGRARAGRARAPRDA